jgi:hypothetical protein
MAASARASRMPALTDKEKAAGEMRLPQIIKSLQTA